MADPLVAEVDTNRERTVYRDAVYARVPGFRPLLLDLVVPTAPAPVPVVLYLPGGGFAAGTHQTTRYPPGQQATEVLTARGLAVAAVGYRLSGEARFPAQVHDVKAAVRWLKHHATELSIDPARVGAWGDSAGGYLTAMLAVTAGHAELDGDVGLSGPDSAIRAGVSWYGPANLATPPRLGPPAGGNTDPARSPEARLLGAAVETVPELAAQASPITHVWPGSAPLLLVHATADEGVPIGQSEELAAAYRRVGAPIELIRVRGAGHGVTSVERGPLLWASAEFLARHLHPDASTPGLTGAPGRSGKLAVFTPGLALARAFYTDVVAPLVTVPHTACLLGEGSEVLGYDSARSTDHEWGPRVQLLVSGEHVEAVRDRIVRELPPDYAGYPTSWYCLARDAITDHIEVATVDEWILTHLGIDPRPGLDHAAWLGLPQQRLLQVTSGAVFRDDLGELTGIRRALAWYPLDVWRWLLASQWRLIGTTEPLLGRTLEAGDQRGARLVTAKLCRLITEMALLQERRYRPYDKWLGTAFAGLDAAATLGPLLDEALQRPPISAPEGPLSRALLTLGHHHTGLAISEPVIPTISDFQVTINNAVRPYPVLNTGEFVTATTHAITDPGLRGLVAVGGIDQLTHADDTLINFTRWPEELTQTYRRLLTRPRDQPAE